MNPNWPTWIFKAILKHFKGALESYTTVYVEGQHMDLSAENSERIEVRIDGPHFAQVDKKWWHIYTEVNLLITVVMNDSNIYRRTELSGLVASTMTDIELLDDSGNSLGCLVARHDPEGIKGGWIATNQFGQIDKSTKIQQTSVEAHYEMELSNG